MKSKKFIEEKLNQLFSQFNEIRIRYEYRKGTNSHIIEITPKEFFEKNDEYLIFEEEFEGEFEKKYPNQEIVFISDGSLTEIKKPDLVIGYNIYQFDIKTDNFDFIIEGFDIVNQSDNTNYYIAA